MTSFKTLIYTKNCHTAIVALNRPHVLNAYNMQMRDDLFEIIQSIKDDDDVKSVLISGQGRAFCSGADLTEFGTAPSQVIAREVRWKRDVWGQLHSLNKPVISALHGYCIGSGLELALLSDIRISSPETKFSMPEVQLGMIPAAGGTQTLPRHASVSSGVELLLTGRIFTAEEALKLKLITRIVPPHKLTETALNICQNLSRVPMNILSATKLALRESTDLEMGAAVSIGSRQYLRTLNSYHGR
ncbi:MAG: enoyl-CoA hydratase/isomerase family protein [Chloroflexota bacterium]|nr:enoyl-CoA hydratase/isomerase family protein [Chloroflexota bacterium]